MLPSGCRIVFEAQLFRRPMKMFERRLQDHWDHCTVQEGGRVISLKQLETHKSFFCIGWQLLFISFDDF
jgi:hypothetical protein